jgi:glycosyltransferase involved in cell wall biosynthesis
MIGYVDKKAKKVLYKNASCFVYPSIYEGFGLPVIEAMIEKIIVVTEKNSSLEEVGGESAFYCEEEYDFRELAEKIEEVLSINEESKREIIIKGLNQAKKFSWEKTARETFNVINEKT